MALPYGNTSPTGKPLDYMSVDPQQLQRNAVMTQLGSPPPATPPSGGAFDRGGQTKQLPGMGADTTNKLVSTGAGVAATAAGSMNPVSIGTDYLGKKLKPKEEMPTFGGEFGDITDSYGRRFEGAGPGIKGGAVRGAGYGAFAGPIGAGVGAGVGAIIGAATRNATSAYSDFSSQDGADAISKAYQQYLGRPASEDEIRGHLVGQGWDPTWGDRWVGEKGLFSVLSAIKNSPEAQAYAARGGAAAPAGDAPAGSLAPMARTAGPNDGVTELSPDAAAQLLAYNQGQEGRRSAFNAETDQLRAQGWDGRPETRGSDVMGQQEAERQALLAKLGIPAEVTGGGERTAVTSVPAGATREVPGGHGGVTGQEAGGLVPAAADGGAAPAQNPGTWDTDGYAAPQSIAQGFNPKAPPGWDQKKWENPDVQHPKYVWGRITQDGDPNDVQQLLAAYPGSTFNGKDIVTIPGVGSIDVYKGASVGENTPQWMPTDEAGGGGGSSAGPVRVDGQRVTDTSGGGDDTLARIKAELARILGGEPNRDALLAQMGGANG